MIIGQSYKESVVLIADIIQIALPEMTISHDIFDVQLLFLVAEGMHLLQLVDQHCTELGITMSMGGERLAKMLTEGVGHCLGGGSGGQLCKHQQEKCMY